MPNGAVSATVHSKPESVDEAPPPVVVAFERYGAFCPGAVEMTAWPLESKEISATSGDGSAASTALPLRVEARMKPAVSRNFKKRDASYGVPFLRVLNGRGPGSFVPANGSSVLSSGFSIADESEKSSFVARSASTVFA